MKLKVVIIILYDSGQRFLLQHRSKDAKVMPDYWAFFGGEIKAGETPKQAVLREAYEELNFRLKSPRKVIAQDFREANINGHMHVYVEYFNQDKSILKLQEGQGWGWFKDSQLAGLKMIERDRKIISSIANYLKNRKRMSGVKKDGKADFRKKT